jgi:hypothetical protein
MHYKPKGTRFTTHPKLMWRASDYSTSEQNELKGSNHGAAADNDNRGKTYKQILIIRTNWCAKSW